MTDTLELPDRTLTVYDDNDCSWIVDVDDESLVRRVVDAWRAGGVDERIVLTTIGGGVLSLYASNVVNWFVSSAETRRRDRAFMRAMNTDADGDGWAEASP